MVFQLLREGALQAPHTILALEMRSDVGGVRREGVVGAGVGIVAGCLVVRGVVIAIALDLDAPAHEEGIAVISVPDEGKRRARTKVRGEEDEDEGLRIKVRG